MKASGYKVPLIHWKIIYLSLVS